MENFKKSIIQEIAKSNSKFKNLKSSNLHELSIKMSAFTNELQRLNKTLPSLINDYAANNKLTIQDKKEIKQFLDKSITDFVIDSGVPGINKNFKLDIDSDFFKS